MRGERSRHGLAALKVAVKVRGLSGIDKRSVAARELLRWKDQLVVDLGGNESLSAAKAGLIDVVARTKVLLDACDAWLLEQPSIVNRKRKSLVAVATQRQVLADSLLRTLQALGLERVARPIKDLQTYIREREARPDDEEPAEIDRDAEPEEKVTA